MMLTKTFSVYVARRTNRTQRQQTASRASLEGGPTRRCTGPCWSWPG